MAGVARASKGHKDGSGDPAELTASRESSVFPGIKQGFPHTYYVLVWCELQGR